MSYTYLESSGDIDGKSMWLFLYPFRSRDRDEVRDEVLSATKNLCEQLLSGNVVDHYGILEYDSAVIDDNAYDDNDWSFNDFKTWVDEEQPYIGVHQAVTDEDNFASAEVVEPGYSAWNSQTCAWVGTAGGYSYGTNDEDRYQNLAIQEPCHNWIVSDYDYVNDMIDGDVSSDHLLEHALGKVDAGYKDYGPSTPMITFYEDDDTHPGSSDRDLTYNGDCQQHTYSYGWNERHDMDVTGCTVDAIEYTAKEEY